MVFISLILINFYKCALRASPEWVFSISHSRRVEGFSAGAGMHTSGPILNSHREVNENTSEVGARSGVAFIFAQ